MIFEKTLSVRCESFAMLGNCSHNIGLQRLFLSLVKAIMRILLVGNYKLDNQSSMLRYAEMLREKLSLRGHYVEIIQPEPRFGHLVSHEFIRKWLGYIDKYLL